MFVEVVATEGPISESRKQALLEIVHGANISPDRIAFVTAYRDRAEPAFKRTFGSIAWNTLVWFMAEPDHILMLREKPSLAAGRVLDLIRNRRYTGKTLWWENPLSTLNRELPCATGSP